MASLVIKVKYEETLRRFNVAINGDQRLDLSMESLRLKIQSLFNLPSDTELRLTYEDEDDDLVTLVNDDDLHDVVRQGLNPVRITVHLNSDQSAQSSSASFSGSPDLSIPSTQKMQPNMSPDVAEVLKAVQESLSYFLRNLDSFTLNSQQNTVSDVAKIVKSIQEPLAHALSKLSLDISPKAASTSPIVADLSDGLSKMGQSYVNATLCNSDATSVSDHDKIGSDSKPNSDGRKHEGIWNGNFDKSTQDAGVGVSVKPPLCPPVSFNKGKNPSCESSWDKMSRSGGIKDMTLDDFLRAAGVIVPQKESVSDAAEKTRGFDCEMIPLGECPFAGIPITSDQSLNQTHSSNRIFNKADSLGIMVHKGVGCDGCGVLPITGPRFKSKVKYDYDLCSICFTKIGNDIDYIRIDFPLAYEHPSSFKAPDVADNFHTVLHKGVGSLGCDGCGALPIFGPRFKSKVKNDYDLCNICFSRMGNDIDYTRIDFSLPPRPFRASGLKIPRPHMMRPHVLEHLRSRLDSCFIMDVNVMDGTKMAPSTPFTKIWRMRNNGRLPWNRGLQLLWIGGDRFRPSDSIEIQVPFTGVDAGLELDIAVDFIAPELPGRYISYWRMADLSGHKFGQRVWVEIQVDPSVDLTHESSPMLNLNLPPNSNVTAFPEVVDVRTEAGLDIEVGESGAQPILDQNHKIQMVGLNFPINGDLLVTGNLTYPTADRPSPGLYPEVDTDSDHIPKDYISLVSYPTIDEFGESLATLSNVQDNDITLDKNSNIEPEYEKTQIEEELLKELAQIGFKQIDLNKEVLRMDQLDLGRSVDDLCDVSEWDPILEELKEMGFEDKDTNKKLLQKNNGSISRVVMDLITEEKA